MFLDTTYIISKVFYLKLLHDAKLLDFLHMSTRDVNYKFEKYSLFTVLISSSKRRPTRRGYLGHITKLARVLEKQANIENEIKEYITSNPVELY